MTPLVALLVGAVGGTGAVARMLLDGAVSAKLSGSFPYGTLSVNILGAFVLGVLFGAAVNGHAFEIAGTGLVGGFTTFSTWMFETHRLSEEGKLRLGVLNLAVSLVLGMLAAWAGQQIGASL